LAPPAPQFVATDLQFGAIYAAELAACKEGAA
jgi:hypothetical protein